MKRILWPSLLLVALYCNSGAAQADDTRFNAADINRVADIGEPVLSPDGNAIVYTVSTANLERDEPQSDLWRVRYDGSGRVQLTHTPDSSESHPQWSGDGKFIAFLADRKLDGEASDDDTKTQVWVMPADGGEARRVTNLPSGV